MNTYNVNWNGLDRGHEGSWEHDQWRGVLDAVAANSPVDLNDVNGVFYKTLSTKFPKVQWVTNVAGASPRTFFRDGREAWASTGVVKFPKGIGTAVITGLGRKVVSGLISYADVLAATALSEEEKGEHPFAILLDALRKAPAGQGLSLDDAIKVMRHYRPGDDINEALSAPKENLTGTPLRRFKAILLVMTYAGLAIQKDGLYYAGQDVSQFTRISGDDLKKAFTQWLKDENLEGSGQASSYITALDDADVIARAYCPNFKSPSVYEMPEASLESLRDFISAETKKEAKDTGSGLFCNLAGLKGVSYWRDGYCAAAINALIKFKAIFRGEKTGDNKNLVLSHCDCLSIALKMFAERRGTESPGGWSNYDEWTKGVREEFSQVGESLLTKPGFDYVAYLRKYSISWPVVNTKFAPHTNDEKHAVLKFLREQKESPKSASWYIDDANRLEVGGNRVDGMSAKTLLYFISELRPAEFAPWTEPTYEGLAFLGLHKGPAPKQLTVETYEDCKAKQQQIIARMKELDIGKATDDPSDPDYRTVNEFLWWLGQDDNKDLIKEKIMSKEFKKAEKKPKTGATLKLFDAVKDDDTMQRLMAALRTKPFAILAGHSGTGKSQLVRRLAYMTCNDEVLLKESEKYNAPGNYCMVQVKPNWHDSTDLLGYYTEMNGGHYHTTPFVEFICKAYAYPETPFFVCLDEMNLAPVEQYFAEFLSAIESYSESKKLTDRLITEKASPDEICGETKLTESLKEVTEHGLTIPRNLFVVGTVNVDETTCQFSRKVLDRAMTILMTAVSFKSMTEPNDPSKEKCLDPDGIKFFLERPTQTALVQGQMAWLDEIQKQVGDTPFAIAYRFANEYALYQSAYQELMRRGLKSDGKTPDPNDKDSQKKAIDHVVLMKLLPRIHGSRPDMEDLFKGNAEKKDGLIKTLSDGQSVEMMNQILGRPGEYLSFWP